MIAYPVTISNQTVKPGNSQTSPVIDTTYWNDTGPWAPAASAAAPGKSRGQLAQGRVTGTCLPTGQAVTLVFEILSNPTGTTNAAFEQDTNGPNGGFMSVAASTTQPFSWLPVTPDWRIRVTAGGTAPTTLNTTVVVTFDRTAGV